MKQKTLFKLKDYGSEFGGSLLKNKRKSSRPFSRSNPLKIVLKADSARSPRLAGLRSRIESLFLKFSEEFNVKLYEKAVCGDHIHFVARFHSKDSYIRFIRALSGTLALQFKIKFKFRPWSRVLKWGRALQIAIDYTVQNRLEALGVIPYQPRKKPSAKRRKNAKPV